MEYMSLQQGASKVVRLSQRMRDRAREHDWDGLARLEQERQKSLESLFAHPQMPGALEQIAGALQEVIALDRESMEIGERVRDELGMQLNQQNQGQRVSRTYLDYSGGCSQ